MDKLAKLMQDIGILWEKYRMMYLNGMLNTLGLALAATAIGCIIGLLCGILNTIPCAKNDPPPKRILLKIIRVIIRIYVEVFRGTPMMLQAVFIFYALPYFTDNALRFDNIWAASILIVSINTGAYMAESVRGGIISIDPGQTEGNPVFMYLDAFCNDEHFAKYLPDYANLDELKAHYQRGGLGDVKVKKFLNNVLQETLEPIRNRREELEKDPGYVMDVLRQGTEAAQAAAADTLAKVKHAMQIDYFA